MKISSRVQRIWIDWRDFYIFVQDCVHRTQAEKVVYDEIITLICKEIKCLYFFSTQKKKTKTKKNSTCYLEYCKTVTINNIPDDAYGFRETLYVKV